MMRRVAVVGAVVTVGSVALVLALREATEEQPHSLATEQKIQLQGKRPDVPNRGARPAPQELTAKEELHDMPEVVPESDDSKICSVERRPRLLAVEPSERVGPDETPRGGRIVPGRYVLESFSLPKGRPGRSWAAELILNADGSGQYLRRMGLANHGSEVSWQVAMGTLTFVTTCPDPGEEHRFSYSASKNRLLLLGSEGDALTFNKRALEE